MRFFLSVSDCVFDVVVVGGAGGLERVRPGFAISVWVRMVGLNCSTFGSPLRSLSRLVLSTSWLTSGLPCRGILLVELSGTTGMGVVGIRGLVGSLLNGDSGLLSLLSVGLRSLGVAVVSFALLGGEYPQTQAKLETFPTQAYVLQARVLLIRGPCTFSVWPLSTVALGLNRPCTSSTVH